MLNTTIPVVLVAALCGACVTEPEAEAPPILDETEAEATARIPLSAYTVNGHLLTPIQRKWVRYIGRSVVDRLEGSFATRLRVAARATWWSLKEGVLDLDNPTAFSNCNYGSYDARIGVLEVCPDPTRAWQVGIAAIQVPNHSYAQAKGVANRLYPSNSTSDVIGDAAELAGFPEGSSTWNQAVGSEGRLRTSWLMRSPAVGITLIEPSITAECITSSLSWCYGTGWDTSARYAPDRGAAMRSIQDLERLLALFQ